MINPSISIAMAQNLPAPVFSSATSIKQPADYAIPHCCALMARLVTNPAYRLCFAITAVRRCPHAGISGSLEVNVVRKPNILLIMTDQQRADSLGHCHANATDTPNLDALARRGVIFENAYSASPACVAARSALLSGRLHHRVSRVLPHGAYRTASDLALAPGQWTLARALRAIGYRTSAFGNMQFQPLRADHGFDNLTLCQAPSAADSALDDYQQWLQTQGLADPRMDAMQSGRHFPLPESAHPTHWLTDQGIDHLSERDNSQPWFTVIAYTDPHSPNLPPLLRSAQYSPDSQHLPRDGIAVNNCLPQAMREAMFVEDTDAPLLSWRADRLSSTQLREFIAARRASIRFLDQSIGRLLQFVDLTDTLVIFVSDHGDYQGHRGFVGNRPRLPFDDLVRVPFFMAGCSVVGKRSIFTPVQSFDLVPTVLELCGLHAAESGRLDAQSLLPLLRGGAAADRPIFSATTEGAPMVRRGRFKHIWHAVTNTHALFDLHRDPDERHNLAGEAQYQTVLEDNVALLLARLDLSTRDLHLT